MNINGVCTVYSELIERGVKEYPRLQEVGEFVVTLKFRSWGKRKGLLCYFITDDGQKFHLYAWRIQSGERYEKYCPRDSWPNFAWVEDETKWLIVTKKSKYGNVYWSTAEHLKNCGGDANV